MSEQAKVRCPKCENILREPADSSVLQAKNKFVEKSEEETHVEKPDLSEKKLMNMANGSGYDVKSNATSSGTRDRRRALRDAPESYRANLRDNEDDRGRETMANEYDSHNGLKIIFGIIGALSTTLMNWFQEIN